MSQWAAYVGHRRKHLTGPDGMFSGKAEIFIMSVSWGHKRVSSALWDYKMLSLFSKPLYKKKNRDKPHVFVTQIYVIQMKDTDVWLSYF